MLWNEKITGVQKHLKAEGCDGWLLYDFQKINPLARAFLALPQDLLTSRRFFYWIPTVGEPVKIVHAIETHVLDHLPGAKAIYLKHSELEHALSGVLQGKQKVAMEFSHHCCLPYVSKVDAGTADLVRSFSVEVVSSANFLQYYTCILDDAQLESHREAAALLSEIADRTWERIAAALKDGHPIDECAVSQYIQEQIFQAGFTCEEHPICAVNAHSADPHYAPKKETASIIKRGDFILIDLWCKKKAAHAVYADITRVAYAGERPTSRHQELFDIVRRAQRRATEYVAQAFATGEYPKGYAVDQVCRQVIEEAGYGKYFTHRTGHNIYTQDHGPGAHIDSLETRDFRTLIPRTCFSIEPGIYLPGAFGVRLEYDLVAIDAHTIEITGGVQNQIVTLINRF